MNFRFRSHVLVGYGRDVIYLVFGIRTVSFSSSIIGRLVLLGRTESERTSVWFMDIASALYTSGNRVGKATALWKEWGQAQRSDKKDG